MFLKPFRCNPFKGYMGLFTNYVIFSRGGLDPHTLLVMQNNFSANPPYPLRHEKSLLPRLAICRKPRKPGLCKIFRALVKF